MTTKFVFCCIFLSVIDASFFACCSCPQPFRSAGCGASNGYQQQPAYQQPSYLSRPIIVNSPAEVPTVIEKHIPLIIPYHGSYDPFSPVQIEEVYVPVIYRPRPRPRPTYYQSVENNKEPKSSHQKSNSKSKSEDACYVNDSGFKCCNTDLENTMQGAYSALKRSPSFNECNIGLMTKVVQKAAQKRFRQSFEVVVSLKSFGSNSAYDGNFTCRFERDGKHFMSYASPVQYDSEDAKSESALSNTDITHDEDDVPPTEEEKIEKIENLNEGLKDIKPKESEIKERLRRASKNGYPAFIENNCIIEFNKVNSTKNGSGFITHEITMGNLSPTISRRKKRISTC
uniref:Ground-like domain-containing protein n=1 Tax=Panagrolaimus superbus TaxID=310955 RepID=A0A914YM95_9BILA